MEGMIYVAMGGAAGVLQAQTVLANNLANVNTIGWRSIVH